MAEDKSFWGYASGVIATVVLTVYTFFMLNGEVETVTAILVALLVGLAVFYTSVINTYEERAADMILKVIFGILCFVMPALAKAESFDAGSGADMSLFAIVTLAIFAVTYVLITIFRKAERPNLVRIIFAVSAIAQILVCYIIAAAQNMMDNQGVLLLVAMIIMGIRALLCLRAGDFDLDDDEDLKAYCRKFFGVLLITAVFISMAGLFAAATTLLMAILIIAIIYEVVNIILYVVLVIIASFL